MKIKLKTLMLIVLVAALALAHTPRPMPRISDLLGDFGLLLLGVLAFLSLWLPPREGPRVKSRSHIRTLMVLVAVTALLLAACRPLPSASEAAGTILLDPHGTPRTALLPPMALTPTPMETRP